MLLKRGKKFNKEYEKLSQKKQQKVEERVRLFIEDPFHPILNNHALHGFYEGKRSISAGGDLRIIFEEKGDYIEVILIRVGSHSQVY